MTTVDTDNNRWSLPGPANVPTDRLQVQLEVYSETVLLRGFEERHRLGSGRSRRTRSPACSPGTWDSPRGCCPITALWWSQGETGQVVALWCPPQVWPLALQQEAFQPPGRLRLPMPGLVFVCSPARAPWVYAALERPTDAGPAALPRPGLQRLPRRRGPAPEATASPKRWDGYPNPSSSPSSPLPGTRKDRSKKHPDNLQALWEELDGTG